MRWRADLPEPWLYLVEGAILGVVGAILPLPMPLIVAVLLVAGACVEFALRASIRTIGLGAARVAAGLATMALVAALPFKQLDARVSLPPEPTAAEVVAALERAGVPVRVKADFSSETRVDLPRSPRARAALDALADATGTPWRRGPTCATGATLAWGIHGGARLVSRAP